ncbi:Lrp/AsnC ligand binding domain-containing protein [Candidatus Woesearchaeota archaeon]|nr:Lrp/AsnC ligand binding domain-containing protein [Candidatus Woesearchaeota archaeon]
MVLAYLLITTIGLDAAKVAKDLTKIDAVDSVHLIYGEYDIIARVKTKNLVELRETTLEKVRQVKGVEKTTTLIVADITKETDNPIRLH